MTGWASKAAFFVLGRSFIVPTWVWAPGKIRFSSYFSYQRCCNPSIVYVSCFEHTY